MLSPPDFERPEATELTPRRISNGRGLDWLAAGWRLFLRSPGMWLALAAVMIVVLAALGTVPLLGWAVLIVAFPALSAGMLVAAQAASSGQPLNIGMLFDGLRQHTNAFAALGLLYLAGALIAGVISFAMGSSAGLISLLFGARPGIGLIVGLAITLVSFTLLWLSLVLALWFSPALILLRDIAPLPAMRLSLRASWSNFPAFLLLGLMLYVLVWAALLPAGLGLLVLAPVLAGALLQSYREVFDHVPALPAPQDAEGKDAPSQNPVAADSATTDAAQTARDGAESFASEPSSPEPTSPEHLSPEPFSPSTTSSTSPSASTAAAAQAYSAGADSSTRPPGS